MKELYLRNKSFLDRLGLLLLVVAVVFAIVFLMGYVAPFVAGFVISLILSPLVDLFHRKWRINGGISAAVLILLTIGAIFALGGWLISRLVAEAGALAHSIPEYIASAQASVQNLMDGWGFNVDVEAAFAGLLSFATTLLQSVVTGGNLLTGIPTAILRVLLAIISAFFFIKDKHIIRERVIALFPERIKARGRKVRQSLLYALGGYARGQGIIMSVVATICVAGLFIIGSPYALFVGIGIAIFDVIPIFGSGGIIIPWAIYSFINGNTTFAIGLLAIWGLVFLTRQLLEPRVVGNRIGIHPIILLASIYVGITVLGPVGILAGPFVTLFIKAVLEASPRKMEVVDT
ncbi:MAG: sporulation integral membrane protein YtvI [Defluviitaleaceae bacterium]|nr:sporulation integral membrane protein YtvI [Defluviitaleaceae bacterium]